MEILWSLGYRKTKAVEKNLYTNQLVQKVVESLANGGKLEDWMVWCSGWMKWKSLTEVKELLDEVNLLMKLNGPTQTAPEPPSFEISESAPVPLHPQPSEEITHKGKKDVTPGGVGWPNKRLYKRIEARFRCIIKSSSLTFRTFTKDVSLGGVALEDPIPNELLNNECTIYITSKNNKKNLKFKIKLVPRPGAKFFSFENADLTFMTELNLWLEQFTVSGSLKSKAS